MNDELNYIGERVIRKRLMLVLSLSLFLLLSLYVFVFAPLYVWLSNDVLYMGTVLPDLLEILLSAVDVFVFGIYYAVFIYSVYRLSPLDSYRAFGIYSAFVLYKNVFNLLMTYLTDGVPTEVLQDILNALLYVFLEVLQVAVASFIGIMIVARALDLEEIRKEAAEIGGLSRYRGSEFLPFSRLLNFNNSIQRSAYWMAFVTVAVRVAQRVYYDVFYTITEGFYENPLVDILWMLLYYTIDIVIYGVVVYFIELLVLTRLHKFDCKLTERLESKSDADALL